MKILWKAAEERLLKAFSSTTKYELVIEIIVSKIEKRVSVGERSYLLVSGIWGDTGYEIDKSILIWKEGKGAKSYDAMVALDGSVGNDEYVKVKFSVHESSAGDSYVVVSGLNRIVRSGRQRKLRKKKHKRDLVGFDPNSSKAIRINRKINSGKQLTYEELLWAHSLATVGVYNCTLVNKAFSLVNRQGIKTGVCAFNSDRYKFLENLGLIIASRLACYFIEQYIFQFVSSTAEGANPFGLPYKKGWEVEGLSSGFYEVAFSHDIDTAISVLFPQAFDIIHGTLPGDYLEPQGTLKQRMN